ncbi:MAG TPA: choice-of-anchor B family protein [Bacteroidota bacterium]
MTKMKVRTRVVILLTTFLAVVGVAFSQTGNGFNMEFLGNKNDYAQVGLYSACWGYTAPNGREYALIGAYHGTAIVDITEAPTLAEVAFIPGPDNFWREMKTYGEYAYIVTESDGFGLQIVDLRNLPDSASAVKTYAWQDTVNGTPRTIWRAHTVSVENNYLYLNGGNFSGIRILDLTDPENPVKAGVYVGPYIHDSYIRNDTIYASAINNGGGVDIIDARDKTNPQRIKLIQYVGSGTHNAWTTEDGKYLLTTDEIGTTDKSLKIWDIRDLQNPVMISEVLSPTAIVHNVFVKGNLAYVAWYNDGIKVIDISDPANPQIVGFYDTYLPAQSGLYDGAWGAYPYYPSGKVIVSDRQTGLYVLQYKEGGTSPPPPPPPPVPNNFALHQNYPNPFNPETTISFDLPVDTFINVKLFGLLGQELKVLRQGIYPAGSYTVRVDASNLSSGVYIYRLETPDFVQTRRMVVMK